MPKICHRCAPVLTILALACAALLETLCVLLFLQKIQAPAPLSQLPHTIAILALHLVASCFFAPAFLRCLPPCYRNKKWLATLLLFGLVAPAPVFGFILPFLILWLEFFSKPDCKKTSNFHIGTEDFLENKKRSGAQLLRHSVIEILHLPNVSERRKAVQSMRWIQTPDATRVLLKAVKDSDEQVRAFAQGRINSLVAKMESAIQEIKEKMETKGSDANSLSVMAEYYQEMIYLELVNPESRKAIQDKITYLFEEASLMDPENAYYHYSLLKSYLLQHKTEKASLRLERLMQLNYHSDLLIPWVLEILFIHRRWTPFHLQLRALLKQEDKNVVEKEICDFWFPGEVRNWNF